MLHNDACFLKSIDIVSVVIIKINKHLFLCFTFLHQLEIEPKTLFNYSAKKTTINYILFSSIRFALYNCLVSFA